MPQFDSRFCYRFGTREVSATLTGPSAPISGTNCIIALTRESWPTGPAVRVRNEVSFDDGSTWNDCGEMVCDGGAVLDKFGNPATQSIMWTPVPNGAIRRTVVIPLTTIETSVNEVVS